MVGDLVRALTANGSASIGWPGAGAIAPGALADLVTVRLDSPRTAGARSGDPLAHMVFAATGADVTDVFVGGIAVVQDGRHLTMDVGPELESPIATALAVNVSA